MEVTNAKKYPKLYDLKNVYDAAHLNENGVPIYTRLVAEKFIALTQTQKGNQQKQKNKK